MFVTHIQSSNISPAAIMVIPCYKSTVPPPNIHSKNSVSYYFLFIYGDRVRAKEWRVRFSYSMPDEGDKFTVRFVSK